MFVFLIIFCYTLLVCIQHGVCTNYCSQHIDSSKFLSFNQAMHIFQIVLGAPWNNQSFDKRGFKVNDAKKRRRSRRGTFQGENIYTMFNPVTGRYHCPRCEKTYTGKGGLAQHYQRHKGSYTHWCDRCEKGFVVKCHYEAHMAKHEGKTFPCSYCGKRFRTKQSLQRHDCPHKVEQETKQVLQRNDFPYNVQHEFSSVV